MKTKLITLAAGAVLLSPALFAVNYAAIDAVLDGITVAPNPGQTSVNAWTDEVPTPTDYSWQISGSGGSLATIVIELAGFANINKFGLYDNANPGSMVQIFSGASNPGDQAVVSIKADGSVYVNFADTGVDFAGNCFGYYLDSSAGTGGGLFKSNPGLNADGLDHMIAYQGMNVDTIQLPGLASGLWNNNEYALFWEDLNGLGDQDFDDFVVMVESVTPCPDSGSSIAFLGACMLGLIALRRRIC